MQNNFNPLDYEYLLKSLTQGTYSAKAQSLKRLNTLITTDKKQFSTYAKRVVIAIQQLLFQPKQDINLLASTLTLQIINLNPREIQYYIRSKLLKQIVKNLGDEKPPIRKTSHYCLLAYVKTYKSFDEIFQVYLMVGIQAEEWQLRQKAVNSLQSILIMEMKYVNWASNQFKKVFEILLGRLKDESVYVQKAVEQCLLSLCKMEDLRNFSKKLSSQNLQFLKKFCEKQLQSGNLQQIKIDQGEKKLTLPLPLKVFYQSKHQSTKNLLNPANSILDIQKFKLAQENSQKRAIINRIQEIKRNSSTMQTTKVQKQEVQSVKKSESLFITSQLKEMKKKTVMSQRVSDLKLEPIKKISPISKQQSQTKTQKLQALISKKLIENLRNDRDWKVRLQAIEELQLKFQSNKQIFDLQSLIKVYIPILVKLLGDANFKVALISLKIIQGLLTMPGISLDIIVPHLVERLSDNKIALRQNISKMIRNEYLKTKKSIWIQSLLVQLKKSTNSNTKEEILAILGKLYEEKDSPSFSLAKVIDSICPLMDDLKTKIKIKTLDLLVLITLKSQNKEDMKSQLMAKLNQIYYEMYIQKLTKELKHQEKQVSGNNSTVDTQPATSVREIRALSLQSKRYAKNPNNTTTTSLQRDKNAKIDPKDTARTSSFMQKASKLNSENRASQQMERSKISLHDGESLLKSSQRKKSFLKSFRKKTHRSTNFQATNSSTATEYEPFQEPQKELRNILNEIKQENWQINFETLNKVKRIVAHHSNLLTSSVIKTLVPQIVRLVENLRSSLSKNAVVTLNELALKIKRGLDSELEQIFTKLIKKSLDTNSFISQEVKKVLVTVCCHCNQSKVVSLLMAAHTSRAIPIKQVVIHILESITFLPKIFEKQLQKVVIILNNFMSEGSSQVREKTKAILSQILSSQRGKQITRLISPQHLMKLRKPNEEKIPELKVVQKEQMFPKGQPSIQNLQPLSMLKRRKKKINVFPEEFNEIETLLQKCQSSDWKVRLESMTSISEIYLIFPEQASQHRLNTKFIDVLSKQIGDPNVKVATNALKIFKNLITVIPSLIENNLSVISNELFNCFGSQKQEVKTLAEQFFDEMSSGIESWMLVQHMCNGILYGVQKAKPVIIQKLNNIVLPSIRVKPNIFQKNVYPMINKVTDEGKPQLMQPLKKLILSIYEQAGQNCMDYLKPKAKLLMSS